MQLPPPTPQTGISLRTCQFSKEVKNGGKDPSVKPPNHVHCKYANIGGRCLNREVGLLLHPKRTDMGFILLSFFQCKP